MLILFALHNSKDNITRDATTNPNGFEICLLQAFRVIVILK